MLATIEQFNNKCWDAIEVWGEWALSPSEDTKDEYDGPSWKWIATTIIGVLLTASLSYGVWTTVKLNNIVTQQATHTVHIEQLRSLLAEEKALSLDRNRRVEETSKELNRQLSIVRDLIVEINITLARSSRLADERNHTR